MEIKLGDLKNSARLLTLTTTQADREHEEGHVLEELSAGVTIAGFRKGKAPARLVREKLGEEKIREQTISHLLSHALSDAIREHNLRMVGNPKLLKSDTSGKNWTFEIEVPLYPEIKLSDYKAQITKALGKDKPEDEDKKIKLVFDTLIDGNKFDIPDALVEEEVDRALSRLVQQTQALNLSVDDYLKSLKKTPKTLREEYQKTATDSLKLDFLLFAVAKDLGITVAEDELLALEKASGTKEDQRSYLNAVLLRRKAVDSLLAL